MSDTLAGLLQVGALIAALAVCWKPLGDHLARVFTSTRDLRVERGIYRAIGVDSTADQRWPVYARSVLAFSAVGVVVLYVLQRVQSHLPLSLGFPDVPAALSFNTSVSFVTNTNWQAYSGEATMGHLVQMAGLAVQNFVSAAVGIAVAAALIRGFTRGRTDRIGNFWVDLVRITVRVLLPLAFAGALVLVVMGVVQNFSSGSVASTLAGHHQTITGGPVASQEAIKELGTNGGGFYNANSAHPFENPNPLSNLLEIFLLMVIPVALTRTFGTMVGDRRQGYAIVAVMGVLWLGGVVAVTALELHHPGAAAQMAGASMEGKETRFGVPGSSLFAVSTTGTSTGAVNSFHSSYGGVAGGLLILDMGLGEVAPGGVGSGLYGMLVLAILSVFVAGLMVGRTPEYLRKKITGREIKLVSLSILTMPLVVLIGTGIAMSLKAARSSMLNGGPHGLSEVLYAFMSAANNNGSAFAGLTADTTFYNVALGLAMLIGRFVPLLLVLALAGSLSRQQPVPATSGTLPTHGALFVSLLVGVTLIVAGLTFFPVLALGPLAEGLS
jgi:K+-transporting ATPase ATPase A chain